MSDQISLADLGKVIAATPYNITNSLLKTPVRNITTDTRTLEPRDVFLALRGEKFDGHEFVLSAIEKGAIAAIVEANTTSSWPDNLPRFAVTDTLEAYQKIGRWWRDRRDIPLIAVTGSVGKTTTKELISAVLATQGQVLKTQLNYNNEIGVPKTLLELKPDDNFAVIEMGMRGRGQIALLTQIARPTIAVITNIGTAHIGLLGSQKAIAEAKCELLAEMPPTGIAILNHDDLLLMETAATVWKGETITYGLQGGDLHGELIDPKTLRVENVDIPLPLAGRHNALNYLAALAVAKVLNISWKPVIAGLQVNMPSGRSQRYDLPNDVVILDETYNAGLESMLAALDLLAETPGDRHIAILGTMKELGERSAEFHQQVGEKARQLNLDSLLVLIDEPETEAIAVGAKGMSVECFTTHAAVLERLKGIIKTGDRLLFKASHSVELNRVVNQLRADYFSNQ